MNAEDKARVLKNHAWLIYAVKLAKSYDNAINELNENGLVCKRVFKIKNGVISLQKRYKPFENIQGTAQADVSQYAKDLHLTKEHLLALQIAHADYQRQTRINKRVEDIITAGDSVFLTLTFSEETMNKYNAQQRRKLVQRFLTETGACYVGNIDFGKNTEREHYHALIGANRINLASWHKFGFTYAESIKNKQPKAISKYISKLSNHALKETTKRSVYIYSRKKLAAANF